MRSNRFWLIETTQSEQQHAPHWEQWKSDWNSRQATVLTTAEFLKSRDAFFWDFRKADFRFFEAIEGTLSLGSTVRFLVGR